MSERLDEMRDAKSLMWDSLQEAPADKRGPLMAQWIVLEAKIAALEAEAGKAGDPVDELNARRAARGGATARTRGTAGGTG